MATDQIFFYDESLKKQIEGSFKSNGREILVSSAYGTNSVPYSDLGACIDYNSQVMAVKTLLSAMARDPASRFNYLQQQKGDEQPQRMESFSCCGVRG